MRRTSDNIHPIAIYSLKTEEMVSTDEANRDFDINKIT